MADLLTLSWSLAGRPELGTAFTQHLALLLKAESKAYCIPLKCKFLSFMHKLLLPWECSGYRLFWDTFIQVQERRVPKRDQKRINLLLQASALWTGGTWVPSVAADQAALSALYSPYAKVRIKPLARHLIAQAFPCTQVTFR